MKGSDWAMTRLRVKARNRLCEWKGWEGCVSLSDVVLRFVPKRKTDDETAGAAGGIHV